MKQKQEGKLGNGLLISTHREVAPGGEREENKKRRQEEKNKTVKERILYSMERADNAFLPINQKAKLSLQAQNLYNGFMQISFFPMKWITSLSSRFCSTSINMIIS